MLVYLELGSLKSGVDLDKVVQMIPELLEEALQKLGTEPANVTVYEEGEDVSDVVDVRVTGVGCGDVTGLVDVDLSLQDNVVCVDEVRLDIGSALEAMNDFGEVDVTAI